jgi:hypothetical protein
MARRKKPLNPRDFENQTDAEIAQVILEDYERALAYQQPYFDKFAKFFKQYNCIHESLRETGSNLFIPYIYNIIETALPKILGSIFDSKPYITYKPVGLDDTAKGEAMTNLVYYQMKAKMKASSRFYEIIKTCLMFGTAISKQTWKYQEKEVTRRDMTVQKVIDEDGVVLDIPVRAPVKKTIVLYDAPHMENIPLESFFHDPAYTSVDESPFGMHEYFRELHELKSGELDGYYKNTATLSEEREAGALRTKYDSSGIQLGNMKDGVRIWEYWTDDWLITMANKSTVIRKEPNPFYHGKKPFIKWNTVIMPNEWYGKSMIETLVDLQAELNTVRNQRVDNVSLAINRMFLIAKGANIDVEQLKSKPNGFIEVDDIDKDIKEMLFKDVTSSAYQEEEVIKTDMDVTSGVHNMDRGQAGERKETATVASLMSSASSERFRMQVLLLEEDPMTELGMQLAELNKQYLEDDTFITITSEDGGTSQVAMSIDDIDVEYDVVSTGTAADASVNKEVRQGQLVNLLSTALNNPAVNQSGLAKEVFKEFGFKNLEELVSAVPAVPPTPPEVPTDAAPQEGATTFGGIGAGALLQQNTNV